MAIGEFYNGAMMPAKLARKLRRRARARIQKRIHARPGSMKELPRTRGAGVAGDPDFMGSIVGGILGIVGNVVSAVTAKKQQPAPAAAPAPAAVQVVQAAPAPAPRKAAPRKAKAAAGMIVPLAIGGAALVAFMALKKR